MPARKPPAPTANQLFRAGIKRKTVQTVEDIFDLTGASDPDIAAKRAPGDRGTVTHTTENKVTMWKPNPPNGWLPRAVPIGNIALCLDSGWLPRCPMCNTTDCTEDPNSCAGRAEPVLFRVCPVCGKHVHDNLAYATDLSADVDGEPDPNQIQDAAYANSSSQTRTKARLDRHMLGFHPEEAAAYGLQPQTPRDPTDMVMRR